MLVIDTAPTGHTLLLLSSTSYAAEVKRTTGAVPPPSHACYPDYRTKQTETIMVTPEATPVYETLRLQRDLDREDCHTWWVVNQSLLEPTAN